MQKPRKYWRQLQAISSLRNIILAKISGDAHLIIQAWERKPGQKERSRRTEIIAAFRQSDGYRMLGNTECEVELLEYVVANGSKLSVGRKALNRLKCDEGR